MYVDPNCKTKKELKERLAKGEIIEVYQPGLGTVPTGRATISVEGPHYPKPHSWYARVEIMDGVVRKVVS